MAIESNLPLRTTRLENDVASIYDILTQVGSVQREHTNRLDQLVQQSRDHTQRFIAIEATLLEVLRRLPEAS